MLKRFRRLFLFGIIVLLLLGCANPLSQPDYETVAPAELTPGEPAPAPRDDVVLTLSGDIGTTNQGDSLVFDLQTLEQLRLVKYSTKDPWLDETVTYTGVLLSDLFRFADISADATTAHMVALDGYEVEIAIEDTEKWPILLATRADGDYMSIDNYGPTRVVFPYNSYPEIDEIQYNDLWIWNLETITVR